MRVDLHLHTSFSDGILDPVSLVALAYKNKVGLISITDHDCLDALAIASRKARELQLRFVHGVELNTEYRGQEVHILGYGFNPQDQHLNQRLYFQRLDRKIRFQKMIQRLNDLGLEVDEKRVNELAGQGSVGRPHLALALVEKKVVGSVDEAFQKFLGYGKPGWVARNYWTPQFAISVIHQAGGIAVLAHPERGGKDFLKSLVSHGLDGLEVFYPAHSSSTIDELMRLAEKYNLLATAGSDYHGINSNEKGPGSVAVPEEVIDNMLRIFKKES